MSANVVTVDKTAWNALMLKYIMLMVVLEYISLYYSRTACSINIDTEWNYMDILDFMFGLQPLVREDGVIFEQYSWNDSWWMDTNRKLGLYSLCVILIQCVVCVCLFCFIVSVVWVSHVFLLARAYTRVEVSAEINTSEPQAPVRKDFVCVCVRNSMWQSLDFSQTSCPPPRKRNNMRSHESTAAHTV